MDNYCLFDPSVDFRNEKDLRNKSFSSQPSAAAFNFPPQNFRNFHIAGEIMCDQYDISDNDERIHSLAHHNYYEIDPDLLEQYETTAALHRNLIKENPMYELERGQASNTAQTSPGKSSSSSLSCDYPSMFNSVRETTPSSTITIDSTDENETMACGKLCNGTAPNVSIHAFDAINQTNVALDDGESVINISSTVTTATGAKKKCETMRMNNKLKKFNWEIQPKSICNFTLIHLNQ